MYPSLYRSLLLVCLSLLALGSYAEEKEAESTKGGINPFTAAIEAERQALIDKLPITMAVLPVTGEYEEPNRHDIRVAVHNGLSSTEYDLVKLSSVDSQLAGLTNGKPLSDFSHGDICRYLGVDGLLLVELTQQDKIYAGAYASFTVGYKAQVYSLKADEIVWVFEMDEAEREGGVSANPLSVVATAITSTQVLTEEVRYRLIDSLTRKFVAEIPRPDIKPATLSKVNWAHSNAINSPFRANSELLVEMSGEEGMQAVVKVYGTDITFPLQEKEKGVYFGRYTIQPADKVSNEIIAVFARKPGKGWTQQKVTGKVSIAN